jgi:predicted nucleic acid-binding protein
LLGEFYTRTLIPAAVEDELRRGRETGIDLPDIRSLSWAKIQPPESLASVPAAKGIGAGEREVLALGVRFPHAVLIMDERLGRAHAEALKLTFTGTLGILLRAKVEGRIPRIEPVLDHLDRLGFRLSTRTRSAALKILDS